MLSLLGNDFMDDLFAVPGFGVGDSDSYVQRMMNTDIKETENGYELLVNLPGFNKSDIKGEVKDGYLTITASTSSDKGDKDKKGRYIRRERYQGTCSRSFYVGDNVTQDDIKAKYSDGVLNVLIPKIKDTPELENKRCIAIE